MPVDTPSKSYSDYLPKWQRCRDAGNGSDAVKAKTIKYLPALDSHANNMPAYINGYLVRALFYNATGRTVEGLTGLIFQKPPDIEDLPDAIKDHLQDVTLTGVDFEEFARRTTAETVNPGRYGVLVDMSTKEASDQRPYWQGYKAEDIISYRVERMGGDEILTRVVLKETYDVPNPKDPFVIECHDQYRVLSLDDPGTGTRSYTVTLWRKRLGQNGKEMGDEWFPQDSIIPERRGAPLDFIPFVFVGPTCTEPEPEKPPLLDLVEVNLSHYRTMADLEHGRHFTALPTPWVSGAIGNDQAKLMIGSSAAWQLELNGEAGMLEFTGQGLGALEKADEQKRKMMATLGARLLEEQPSGSETATAVGMRHSGEHATLRTIGNSVERALTMALRWHAWWVGAEAKPSDVKAAVKLNREFFSVRASPEEVKALMLAWQGEAISFKTLYSLLQAGGWTREGVDADEEQKEIEEEGEMAGPEPIPPGMPGGPPQMPGQMPPGMKPGMPQKGVMPMQDADSSGE